MYLKVKCTLKNIFITHKKIYNICLFLFKIFFCLEMY
jgi:hypothetical protein